MHIAIGRGPRPLRDQVPGRILDHRTYRDLASGEVPSRGFKFGGRREGHVHSVADTVTLRQ